MAYHGLPQYSRAGAQSVKVPCDGLTMRCITSVFPCPYSAPSK
jgi:hypothetical protein